MAANHTSRTTTSCSRAFVFQTPSNCSGIAGALDKSDLIKETVPIVSVYLGSKAGRAPKRAKNDHRHHASLNIVAHKSSDYVCNFNVDDRKLRSLAPKVGARIPELDNIGVVVSANHPPKSTFLAPAIAEYCVARSGLCMLLLI